MSLPLFDPPRTCRVLSGAILCWVSATSAPATTVDVLCAAQDNPCVVSDNVSVDNGSVFDLGGRDLQVTGSGLLDAGGGTMTFVGIGNLLIEEGGEMRARGSGSLAGGSIEIRAQSATIAGTIDVSGSGAGDVAMVVMGEVNLTGRLAFAALARSASGGLADISCGSYRQIGVVDGDAGSEDSLGGDFEVRADGDIRVENEISVVGPDGGTATLEAGAGPGDGNVVITETARILAEGAFQGGFGGAIDITATGDGISTGHITADGDLRVDGDTAGEEFGGGSGGCLALNADGNVINNNPNARLSVIGGGPDGDGSELDIAALNGRVSIAGTLDLSAVGNEGGGGALAIDALGPIDIFGTINASGGDGGEVALVSAEAGVTLDEESMVQVSGRDIGSGGTVCLESASVGAGQAASVVINGPIESNGGSTGGDGGSVDIIGLDSARLTSTITADGGLGGGLGGSVSFTASGPVFLEGTVQARGRGAEGGSVAVDAERIDMSGSINVEGSGRVRGDTDVGLRSTGDILVSGEIVATGSPGSGGLVEVVSDTALVISGTIIADGNAEPGGLIDARGCNSLLCGFNAAPDLCLGATGRMQTLGPNGVNRVTGRSTVDIFGEMQADVSGANEVVVPPPFNDRAFVLGEIDPQVIPVEADLEPCTLCGNGQLEDPPEECDDGNIEDGDGCSANCRIENFDVGDVNGDARVDQDDFRFLATEIFDGDGDRIEDVSLPAFAGTPGADTNGDRRITAADFIGLANVL